MSIIIDGITKCYGEKTVLSGFSAEIEYGERVCFMGPSGCGKTTLMNIILGLTSSDSGSVSGLPDSVSAVFQEDRLAEYLSARANIRLVTGYKKHDPRCVSHLIGLGLGDSLEKPVRSLSGGMKRRVSIARALSVPHSLLLLDEAFKGLDGATREQTVAYLLSQCENATVVSVTHEKREAELLGARIIEMPR